MDGIWMLPVPWLVLVGGYLATQWIGKLFPSISQDESDWFSLIMMVGSIAWAAKLFDEWVDMITNDLLYLFVLGVSAFALSLAVSYVLALGSRITKKLVLFEGVQFWLCGGGGLLVSIVVANMISTLGKGVGNFILSVGGGLVALVVGVYFILVTFDYRA